jgi:type IV pilus assembly protein PilE
VTGRIRIAVPMFTQRRGGLWRGASGVTAIELVIVLAIVGILAGLSVPAYRDHVLRANRGEARAALLSLATAEEKFYLQCNEYTGALDAAAATACSPGNLRFPTASERGYYALAVTSADANGWTATATAVSTLPQYSDTRCRTFQLTSTGAKTARNSGNSANDSECWNR